MILYQSAIDDLPIFFSLLFLISIVESESLLMYCDWYNRIAQTKRETVIETILELDFYYCRLSDFLHWFFWAVVETFLAGWGL
jgi:hypothetical protein